MAVAHAPLRRSSTNRVFGGVAAGVAEHFGLDVTLVRVLWALLALGGGLAFFVYLILWIALPSDDTIPLPTDALRIAEERYAKGDITKEEFDRLRQDLAR